MSPTLRIIRPSSREQTDLLPPRLAELRAAGFGALYDELPADPDWAYVAAPAAARARALSAALTEPDSDVVVSARGGYGASDLLPLLDWEALGRARAKLLVGFSDVSALHSGLYARLGWPGLHAPMPATSLWRQNGDADVDALLSALRAWHAGDDITGTLSVAAVAGPGPAPAGAMAGPLFGGCFTVLTNLLGTPYFPRSLAGHLVFLEDTDEHPARLARALNHWQQAGALAGVRALVIGSLRRLGEHIPDSAPFVLRQLAQRAGVPVFHTPLFGHTSPNLPLAIGAEAQIVAGTLSWRLRQRRTAT